MIRLYQYSGVTGSAASDVDQACQEATREDPLGAYAVDYIRYDVQQTASYYEVDVSLTYRVAPEELSQVISVTASTAVAGELQDLLPPPASEGDLPHRLLHRRGQRGDPPPGGGGGLRCPDHRPAAPWRRSP